ncbi:hypothetical protein EYF80_030562 [Liparis tanakae]|uniref:Uncharacterized protein n=1 Tax=Liparis tanakae TaxID=230148 RepID=A0A4Z2H0A3_9TELE|nr:hypothetical protein EYF80_030562 [Liparis tanakae]
MANDAVIGLQNIAASNCFRPTNTKRDNSLIALRSLFKHVSFIRRQPSITMTGSSEEALTGR